MLLPNELVFMQRLQDAIRHGYEFYTTGVIELEKWPAFERKMSDIYEANLPKTTRFRRRKAGEAVCLLYAYARHRVDFNDNPSQVRWCLCVTEGAGRVHAREQLSEFRKERYNLSFWRKTKAGELPMGKELVHDGVGWSWQFTRAQYNSYRDEIHHIAARKPESRAISGDVEGPYDQHIEDFMSSLYRASGFRLMRRQVGKLVTYARGEWRRLRPSDGPQIRVRSYLPYVQRLANKEPAKKAED